MDRSFEPLCLLNFIIQRMYCIVQRFEEITNSVFENLDNLSKKYVYTFFFPVKKSVLYDLIE